MIEDAESHLACQASVDDQMKWIGVARRTTMRILPPSGLCGVFLARTSGRYAIVRTLHASCDDVIVELRCKRDPTLPRHCRTLENRSAA